jgi:N-acetylmuramic acid 6-phosphate etherase/N-acetylglucosamine-6-phosphate deacetylase
MLIAAQNLFINGAFTGPAAVEIDHGIITRIIPGTMPGADITLPHGILTPGLIDLHNNGAFGVDFSTATPEEWDHVIPALAAHGVTSILPTIITAPISAIHDSAAAIQTAMSRHGAILGLHLEGPFLAPARRGAHRQDWLQIPDEQTLDSLLASPALQNILRIITLAPELPGALPAISRLAATGARISLGHTNATAVEMRAAATAGATLVTHVFNAQSPLTHRAPGAPGIALTDPRLNPCLIADALHVDPAILALAFAACPRAIAVTDSIALAGLPAGSTQTFGGAPATLGPDGLARRPDGTIAGAAITLDEAIRRLIAAGIPPEVALAATTSRPADALNLPNRGRIAPGQRADLIWWSEDFCIQKVWTAGLSTPHTQPKRGTETARTDLADLEERPTTEIVQIFLSQERAAQFALAPCAEKIAALADAIAPRLAAGGRLFYAGAGTSGRLAMLDAAECTPTFGIPPGLMVPIIAGGPAAFLNAVEGAEDSADQAITALTAHNFSKNDSLIGIAASGATPFTLAAIRHAKSLGALTGAIVNNSATQIATAADIAIEIFSGPEIIAGSTRLSAGTTQKIALNTLSSTIMIRLHKTYGPYMVDLQATNTKLRRRAARITATIAHTTQAEAEAALATTNYEIKPAIIALRLHTTRENAGAKLAAAEGSLRKALQENEAAEPRSSYANLPGLRPTGL